jgi:hypothetical protein
MKKVICAIAAFAMVGGVASIASAGNVSLSGDARARWIYNDSGIDDTSYDKMDSRVRVKFDAKTEAGAYIKARLRFLDGTWGQGSEYTPDAKGGGNVWSDYAYLGFKTGNVDIAAGKMPIGFTPWFVDDERADRFRVKYAADGLLVAYTYDMKRENYADDEDKGVHGVSYVQSFGEDLKAMARVVYVNDNAPADRSGFKASVNVAMSFAGNNIIVEQSWKEAGTEMYSPNQEALSASDIAALVNTIAEISLERDTTDQWGGYVEWNATYGGITPVARLGYTSENFTADQTFGWLMIGGDEPISKIGRIGQGGDTIFLGLSSKFQTTETMSLQGNLVFMDIDSESYVIPGAGVWHTSVYGDNPIEISGQAVYDINASTALTAKLGYLISDSDYANVDDAFAGYVKMEVGF